jgi:hypothetical protein
MSDADQQGDLAMACRAASVDTMLDKLTAWLEDRAQDGTSTWVKALKCCDYLLFTGAFALLETSQARPPPRNSPRYFKYLGLLARCARLPLRDLGLCFGGSRANGFALGLPE